MRPLQGTNKGAVIRAVNLDGGIKESFECTSNEVSYGSVTMGPCLFQDDISRLAEDLDSLQDGNNRILDMAEKKLLDFNQEKSCFILIGKRKFQKEVTQRLKDNPIRFCNAITNQRESVKYLCDYISSSLPESVFVTIKKRRGLCLKLISEIKVTIEDCRGESTVEIISG